MSASTVYSHWVVPHTSHAPGGGTTTLSRKSWRRRWFELDKTELRYRKAPGGRVLGRVRLGTIVAVGAAEASTGEGFYVETADRTYLCRASDSMDCQVCGGRGKALVS